MKRRNVLIISFVVIVLIGILIYYSITRQTHELTLEEKEALAKCLTEKEIYLYGSVNCPNCEVQKEEFGEAVKYITYINCFIEEDKCVKYKEEKVYPFWGMGDEVIIGPIQLHKLKEKTSC